MLLINLWLTQTLSLKQSFKYLMLIVPMLGTSVAGCRSRPDSRYHQSEYPSQYCRTLTLIEASELVVVSYRDEDMQRQYRFEVPSEIKSQFQTDRMQTLTVLREIASSEPSPYWEMAVCCFNGLTESPEVAGLNAFTLVIALGNASSDESEEWRTLFLVSMDSRPETPLSPREPTQ